MANTHPVNDTVAVTEHILSQARRYGYTRVYPVAAVSKGLEGEELAEIGQLRRAGCVAISDDGRPVRSSELMRRALSYARHFDLPLVQHAQDMELSGEGAMHEGVWSTRLGVPAIPAAAEDAMVARDLLLVELTGGRYHLQHTSSRRSLELIREGKKRGLDVTCEVTPHHLFLTDEEVAKSGLSTNTKMNPPLRSERDREALLAGHRRRHLRRHRHRSRAAPRRREAGAVRGRAVRDRRARDRGRPVPRPAGAARASSTWRDSSSCCPAARRA